MKIISLLSLFFLAVSLNAQSVKKKSISVPFLKYSQLPQIKGASTYYTYLTEDEDESTGIDIDLFIKKLTLSSYSFLNDTSADFVFAISGLDVDDLNVNLTRNKGKERFEFEITPKNNAFISIMTLIKGKPTHLEKLKITPTTLENGTVSPEYFNIPFSEKDIYLEDYSEGKVQMKSAAIVSKYLKQLYKDGILEEKIANYIKNRYDTQLLFGLESYIYLKDKKDPSLEEKTKESIIKLSNELRDVESITDLESKFSMINNFETFWTTHLEKSLSKGKSNHKVSWDIYNNLYKASLLKNNYTKAEEYYTKMKSLGVKKLATFLKSDEVISNKKFYLENFDPETKKRKTVDSYKVDSILKSAVRDVANDDYSKSNNLEKVTGFVITKDGEKREGKISLSFNTARPNTQGTIIDISSDPGKQLALFYVNEKGKNKAKNYKGKDLKEFQANGKTYEPVKPKADAIDTAINITSVTLNRTVFMEVLFKSEKIKIYKDLRSIDTYYLLNFDEEKAHNINTVKDLQKNLKGCDAINTILDDNFKINSQNLINVSNTFSKNCN